MVRIVDRLTVIAVGVFLLVVVAVALLVAWLVGSVLDLRDENDDVNAVTRQLVVDLADEVERSLVVDCDLGNDQGASVIRSWELFIEFFTNSETTAEASARAQAFLDLIRAEFPAVSCEDQ